MYEYINSDFATPISENIDPLLFNIIILYLYETNKIFEKNNKIKKDEFKKIIQHTFNIQKRAEKEHTDFFKFLKTHLTHYQNSTASLLTKIDKDTYENNNLKPTTKTPINADDALSDIELQQPSGVNTHKVTRISPLPNNTKIEDEHYTIINLIYQDITKVKFLDIIYLYMFQKKHIDRVIISGLTNDLANAFDATKVNNEGNMERMTEKSNILFAKKKFIYNHIYNCLFEANFIPILMNKLYYDNDRLEELKLDPKMYLISNNNTELITYINTLLDEVIYYNNLVINHKLRSNHNNPPDPGGDTKVQVVRKDKGYELDSTGKNIIKTEGMGMGIPGITGNISNYYMKDCRMKELSIPDSGSIPYFVTHPHYAAAPPPHPFFKVKNLPKCMTINHQQYMRNTNLNLLLNHMASSDNTLGHTLQNTYNNLKIAITNFNKVILPYFEYIYFYKKFKKMNETMKTNIENKTDKKIEKGNINIKKYPGQFIFLNNFRSNLMENYVTNKNEIIAAPTLGLNNYAMPMPDEKLAYNTFNDHKTNSLTPFKLYERLFDYSNIVKNEDNKFNVKTLSHHNEIFYKIVNGKSKLELRNIAENTIIKKMEEYTENVLDDSEIGDDEIQMQKTQMNKIFENFKILLLPLCDKINSQLIEHCFLIDKVEMKSSIEVSSEVETLKLKE